MSRSGCDRPDGHFATPQIVTTRKLPNPLTLIYSSACSDISIFPNLLSVQFSSGGPKLQTKSGDVLQKVKGNLQAWECTEEHN